jgi:SAM-dependent methyltransferase
MDIKFSENDIIELYETKVKKPESYFNKYTNMPVCPVKSFNYKWAHRDFPRNICILDFIEWINKYNIKSEHIGYTCENDPELEFIQYNKSTLITYPPYDLHTISNNYNNEFDFFLFNQTIEHLYNPFEAIKQIYYTLKPGGYVFTSVPTINIPHSTPIHYNGFNPMGLAMLFKTNNFEIIEIGQWGNYDYISKLFETHGWPGYDDLHHNNIIINEERNVCQCWILAKKL